MAFGIYVHWPFCASKCPYCDFNSHVRESINLKKWRSAYIKEIKQQAHVTSNREVSSIFFGGGTPSLMPTDLVEEIIRNIKSTFNVQPNCEVTLEANPSSIEAAQFRALKDAGVNRLSLGVQSLQPPILKFLGRRHSREEAIETINRARKHYRNFSFDLIYSRPGDTLDKWNTELLEALTFEPPHISLYQLTIEPGTVFEQQYRRGDFVMPSDKISLEQYLHTVDVLKAKGYSHYEVSNFALPNHECQHNMLYWRYNDYIGIGPGAHGRISVDGTKYATKQYRYPEKWLGETLSNSGEQYRKPLDPKEQFNEHLLMGLRIDDGVPFKYSLMKEGTFQDKLENLSKEGLLTVNPHNITLTAKGRLKLNAVVEYLYA